ncbi:4-hydroxyphenylpyruvate dioxygenase [Solimonas marina]|uniref:4-hydroxyphenylpyruvate dioxygenase n=1 Tax=Solimonas marina TaxID=2714601 RepID=A0A969W9M1_9GAMM|nr:4-hydroxyphenylpyruvate dioxygenase [Solimonas marina]NKF22060.1 4-hydroxyphenylpyruvate dioxygenase [Solimonas marina]
MTAAKPHAPTHNPLATDGFEFVEFTAPTAEGIAQLHGLFEMMGFKAIAKHRRKDVTLFRQGQINFLVNGTPYTHFEQFARTHGPSACAMGWRVADAPAALAHALANGATPFDTRPGYMELNLPAVYGIGNSVLYFIDRYGSQHSIYDADFRYFDEAERDVPGVGLTAIDHLTHNVSRGHMDTWSGFYERIANFREIRYFDIEGKQTGLVSRAMTSPCGKIRIPINESADDKSQIEEFIREYRGEGIQHIALTTDDIYATVAALRDRGVSFMDTPDTYYARVDARVANHGEPLARLQELNILIDGAPVEGILLQIFTSTVIGPIFFEIIQRKGNEGFGEGNFKALFESIEEDQIRRGVLAA